MLVHRNNLNNSPLIPSAHTSALDQPGPSASASSSSAAENSRVIPNRGHSSRARVEGKLGANASARTAEMLPPTSPETDRFILKLQHKPSLRAICKDIVVSDPRLRRLAVESFKDTTLGDEIGGTVAIDAFKSELASKRKGPLSKKELQLADQLQKLDELDVAGQSNALKQLQKMLSATTSSTGQNEIHEKGLNAVLEVCKKYDLIHDENKPLAHSLIVNNALGPEVPPQVKSEVAFHLFLPLTGISSEIKELEKQGAKGQKNVLERLRNLLATDPFLRAPMKEAPDDDPKVMEAKQYDQQKSVAVLELSKKYSDLDEANRPLAHQLIVQQVVAPNQIPQEVRDEVLFNLLPSLSVLDKAVLNAPLYKKLGSNAVPGPVTEMKNLLESEHVTDRNRADLIGKLLEKMTENSHLPATQKAVIGLANDFFERGNIPEEQGTALLKKLANAGSDGISRGVQEAARDLFKRHLRQLSPGGQAEVATHWVGRNAQWDAAVQKDWKNIGYAAGTVAVAVGGIAASVSLEKGSAGAVAGNSALLGAVLGVGAQGNGLRQNIGVSLMQTQVANFHHPKGSEAMAHYGPALGAGAVAQLLFNGATQAVKDAGGFMEALTKLHNSPSVQTTVQQRAHDVFSFDKLPTNRDERATAVQALAPHLEKWLNAASTFSPAMQSKVHQDLTQMFDSQHYRPEDWPAVEQAIAPARALLAETMQEGRKKTE